MGLIERFPGGRRPKANPRAVKREAKAVVRARAIVVGDRAKLPATVTIPAPNLMSSGNQGLPAPAEETLEAKLSRITSKSLDLLKQIVDMPCAPDNLKLLSIKKDAALSMVSLAAKG